MQSKPDISINVNPSNKKKNFQKPKRKRKNKPNNNKPLKNNPTSYINKLNSAFSRIRFQKQNKKVDQLETPYKYSLLFPEFAYNSKIPGEANPTVSIHRKIILRTTVNASGNACAIFYPNGLRENASTAFGLWFSNDVTYTSTSNALTAALDPSIISNPFNIPVSTVKSWRVVSASIVARSVESALNIKGDIHISTVDCSTVALNATANADMLLYTTTQSISQQQAGTYVQAHVENKECARAIWLPHDKDDLIFTTINGTSPASEGNIIPIIFSGLPASSAIEFEAFYNFEVTPSPGSILHGMETICTHNTSAERVWRTIRVEHMNKITMAYVGTQCIADLASKNMRDNQQIKLSKNSAIGNRSSKNWYNNEYEDITY